MEPKGELKAEEEARDQTSHSSAAHPQGGGGERRIGGARGRGCADWQKAVPNAGGDGRKGRAGGRKNRRMKEVENRKEKSHLVFSHVATRESFLLRRSCKQVRSCSSLLRQDQQHLAAISATVPLQGCDLCTSGLGGQR